MHTAEPCLTLCCIKDTVPFKCVASIYKKKKDLADSFINEPEADWDRLRRIVIYFKTYIDQVFKLGSIAVPCNIGSYEQEQHSNTAFSIKICVLSPWMLDFSSLMLQ